MRHRGNLSTPEAQVTRGFCGHAYRKNFEIWAFKSAFPAFWSKIRVFEQNTDIIKFWLLAG